MVVSTFVYMLPAASRLFEVPFTDESLQADAFDTAANRALAHAAAVEGIVLLKNEKAALPLSAAAAPKLAVLGELGASLESARSERSLPKRRRHSPVASTKRTES